MAALTVQQITRDGITPALAAAASGGDTFSNSGREILWFQNNHASDPRTLTIVTSATVDGLAVTDRTVTVTAVNDNAFCGPFPVATYGTTVSLTYSDSAADCKIGVFRP